MACTGKVVKTGMWGMVGTYGVIRIFQAESTFGKIVGGGLAFIGGFLTVKNAKKYRDCATLEKVRKK